MSAPTNAQITACNNQRTARQTELTAIKGDGSNLSPTQLQKINDTKAAITAEGARPDHLPADPKESIASALPDGLRTAPLAEG